MRRPVEGVFGDAKYVTTFVAGAPDSFRATRRPCSSKAHTSRCPKSRRTLAVDTVVEGSVIRAADRVRVHVQMIRGQTDEVQITVTAHEDGRTASPPRAVAADVYDNYLRGRFALNRKTRAGATESSGYFEAAIAADPSFAPAYAGIASAYTDLGLV